MMDQLRASVRILWVRKCLGITVYISLDVSYSSKGFAEVLSLAANFGGRNSWLITKGCSLGIIEVKRSVSVEQVSP